MQTKPKFSKVLRIIEIVYNPSNLFVINKAVTMSETETAATEKEATNDKDTSKVCILLNATGNVPIIKKRKWTVDPNKTVSSIMQFFHHYLKMEPQEQLFLYVNQTFAPSPDQLIKNLYDCHGTNGKLVLYYCKNQAWG